MVYFMTGTASTCEKCHSLQIISLEMFLGAGC